MKTARLEISNLKDSDKEEFFYNVANDKKVLETFICKYEESLENFDFAPYLNMSNMFAIRLNYTGKLIGIILHFAVENDAIEIGYCIGSKYWNNGYATEALKVFLNYCFKEKVAAKIYASYFAGNDSSGRVMEKCGMKYDRLVENGIEYQGLKRDLIYYVIEK
ncbi:MAG: GNAT family N-acetyltransferase [Butyrivibrio sp.]|nr:GNAT family N-acetyltransferase [Butyrivibrio sp.]